MHKVRTRIVRIFNTYGPRMRLEDGRVLPNFLCQALRGEPLTIYGDGSQTRSFCYVDDLVEGVWRLLWVKDPEPYPVNIGNPDEMTIRQFADRILAATGSTSPIVAKDLPADDPKRRKPDIARARRLLDWSPRVSLDIGLERTVRDFRARLGVQVAP
jgi:nucleoside-diphosphate-sugar epimerase